MNFKEFGILTAAIKTYFPRDNMFPTSKSMDLWYDALKDLNYESADASLKKYVQTNKFPPTIADIRCNVPQVNENDDENEIKAWATVKKAIRNSTYHAEEEFSRLPDIIKRVVSSPGQLTEWATMENLDGKGLSVIQSNFMRAYRAEVQREAERRKLSPELLRLNSFVENKIVGVQDNLHNNRALLEERVNLEQNSVPMPERVKDKLSSLFK